MNSTSTRVDNVIIVDGNTSDYLPLVNELGHHFHISLYSTGEEALRASEASMATVWIVNIRLPDISGVNFLTLIRRRLQACRIFLIGNTYSTVEEVAARGAGATGYLCKPASADWLKSCRPHCRSPTIRAGPIT